MSLQFDVILNCDFIYNLSFTSLKRLRDAIDVKLQLTKTTTVARNEKQIDYSSGVVWPRDPNADIMISKTRDYYIHPAAGQRHTGLDHSRAHVHGMFPQGVIEYTIENTPCIIFVKMQTCGLCQLAKEKLEKIGARYITVEFGGLSRSAKDDLFRRSRMTTVPQIFIRGICIGGYIDLKKLDETRELKLLLKAANAL